MKIKTKAQFNALSQAGKLGNFLRTWKDIDIAFASGSKWFTIQGTRPQSPWFRPVVNWNHLYDTVHDMSLQGCLRSDIYFREIPHPEALRVLNGEVSRGLEPQYLYLLHGAYMTKENLRHDLQKYAVEKKDSVALITLRSLLGEEYETLEEIWADYPDSIIEFTMWDRPMGVLNKRLLIWEVRDF